MILYITGLPNEEVLNWLKEVSQQNILISFKETSSLRKLIEIKKTTSENINIFVDSGAFSAWTKGIKIDIDEYITFLNLNHEMLNLYASLDVIPNSDSVQSVLESSKKTWDNYLYMRERVIDKDKLVMTFHYGEDYSLLENILKYEDDFGNIKYLALGGIAKAPIADRKTFIENCYRIIKESGREDIKIHLFGVTDISLCDTFGGTSVDSTTWVRAASFGELCTSLGRVTVSDRRRCDKNHLLLLSETVRNDYLKEIESYGIPLEELMTDSKKRELFNVMYMVSHLQSIPEFNIENISSQTKTGLW